MQTEAKDSWKLFKPSACSLRLKATDQEGAFREITSILVKAKALPEELSEPAVRAFLERESVATTGLGMNVAVPHVKLSGLEEPVLSLCLAPHGIEWNAVDGEPARIFFAVLRPDRAGAKFDPDRHLEMMRWISRLVREADFRRFALAVGTRTQLVALLREMSEG